MLVELQIEEKLLTITADNALNNETLAAELYFNLVQQYLASTIALRGKVLRQPLVSEVLQQVQDTPRCTQNIQKGTWPSRPGKIELLTDRVVWIGYGLIQSTMRIMG
jgi:hypothetical protein